METNRDRIIRRFLNVLLPFSALRELRQGHFPFFHDAFKDNESINLLDLQVWLRRCALPESSEVKLEGWVSGLIHPANLLSTNLLKGHLSRFPNPSIALPGHGNGEKGKYLEDACASICAFSISAFVNA
jgi:hypothetical protein